MLISDVAGNDERMAFLYDSTKVRLLEKVGEIAILPAQFKSIKLPGVTRPFDGFDRNPYLAAFQAGQTSFLLVNVHLFYGSEKKADVDRRALETFAVARWADLRRKSPYSFTREIIALGDFNMPKRDEDDPIYKALTSCGLELPEHSSEIGSNLESDKHYDQIAFFPGPTKDRFTGRTRVFDYDGEIFPALWQTAPNQPEQQKGPFFTYVRYYISNHRPFWIEVSTQQA